MQGLEPIVREMMGRFNARAARTQADWRETFERHRAHRASHRGRRRPMRPRRPCRRISRPPTRPSQRSSAWRQAATRSAHRRRKIRMSCASTVDPSGRLPPATVPLVPALAHGPSRRRCRSSPIACTRRSPPARRAATPPPPGRATGEQRRWNGRPSTPARCRSGCSARRRSRETSVDVGFVLNTQAVPRTAALFEPLDAFWRAIRSRMSPTCSPG